jgi:diadenosine tetraphosphate (Ap4A) HIT family hydrolase
MSGAGFDADAWSRKISGDDCPVCAGQDGGGPGVVAELASGRVVLQDDAAFRGYCILYHRRHVTELHELTPAEQAALIGDVSRIAAALMRVCRPAKLNYAILGNVVPHLHVHVIPRYPADGWWGQAIWLRPAAERCALPAAEWATLHAELRVALAAAEPA